MVFHASEFLLDLPAERRRQRRLARPEYSHDERHADDDGERLDALDRPRRGPVVDRDARRIEQPERRVDDADAPNEDEPGDDDAHERQGGASDALE
ncbi:hypothetical protein [Haloplanus rubicundus]|uniref:hypothetical protein n=1 Tax=Haloplanus rubicundus TaxID=1547898 RepID=UPI0013008068|nr:hypothetical protein [Haloplanus rubicundus]